MFPDALPPVEVLPPTDYVGRVIQEGDVVCFPTRKGADMRLKSAVVSEISGVVMPDQEPAHPIVMVLGENGRRSPLMRLDRCIVIGNIYDEEEFEDASV